MKDHVYTIHDSICMIYALQNMYIWTDCLKYSTAADLAQNKYRGKCHETDKKVLSLRGM